MLEDAIKNAAAIQRMHQMARELRRICTDIVRQTTSTPYYGKIGAAALYAGEDYSEAQRGRIDEAGRLLNTAGRCLSRANELLLHIAVEGGTTQAAIWEEAKRNYNYGRGQVITIPDDTAENEQK